MNVIVQSFNNKINSKSGISLPEGKTRGTPEWLKFEELLRECLEELGHSVHFELEHPREPFYKGSFEKSIHVHRTRREVPDGDLFYMQMHLRELFTLDPNGWGADASPVQFSPDVVQDEKIEEIEQLSDQLLASGISKCDQPQVTGDTPPRFILVPIQIPRDYTIKWHSPITVKYFIDSIQAWAYETKNHVAFKLHPNNRMDFDIIRAVEEGLHSRYCHKVEGNIHELIKRSDGVFVINSGTGFEALIHGKPVCTFGNCDYRGATFNADIRRICEARNFIYSYDANKRNIAYRFVWFYLYEHGYYLKDPNVKKRLKKGLKQCMI